jgi:hypothetical protein
MILSVLTLPISIRTGRNAPPLTLQWENNFLTISGEKLPGRQMKVNYLEAYCRPNSHTTDWSTHTVIGHKTELISASKDGTLIKLRDTLNDGVIVDHTIKAGKDEVDFRIFAHNPTAKESEAHWAQPCVRVGEFTGTAGQGYDYIKKSFVFLDGHLAMMPTKDWATEARYTPGQVWAAPGVSPDDVNPRPLNPHVPSNGLIGCFSADGKTIFAMAFDHHQELFQGVATCLHSDFRIGGLKPGETKRVHGKIYFVPNDVPALLRRYERDFRVDAPPS